MRIKLLMLGFVFTICASEALLAQYKRTGQSKSTGNEKPKWTYDVGVSSGNYNGTTYNEANLGLNWNLTEYLTWRNSLYTRFGSKAESNSGLDTSLRLNYRTQTQEPFAVYIYAGPGYRISKTEASGLFGEAGANLRLAGLSIGGGVKMIQYNSPGSDTTGSRPKFDTTFTVTLAGGGAF